MTKFKNTAIGWINRYIVSGTLCLPLDQCLVITLGYRYLVLTLGAVPCERLTQSNKMLNYSRHSVNGPLVTGTIQLMDF